MIPVVCLLVAGTHPIAVPAPAIDLTPFVQEASRRTGVPEAVIWAVMGAESNRQPGVISPKGATGLMQLMPATWSLLRDQLALGNDPFDPHDNIIAGAYYLRFLYDRYGMRGMFGAYNAGPGRYEAHRDLGQALPAETQAYMARIADRLAGQSVTFSQPSVSPKLVPWTEAVLFIAAQDATSTATSPFGSTATPFVPLSESVSEQPQ